MKNKLVAKSMLVTLFLTAIFMVSIIWTSGSSDPASSSTRHVVQYGFRTRYTGTAQWTTADAHSGSLSFNLSTGSSSSGAAIIALKCNLVSSTFPFEGTLSDLYYAVLTYWAKNVTWTTVNFYPWVQVYLDMDDDGVFDWGPSESDWILQGEPYYWLQYNTAPEESGWKQFNASALYFFDGNYTYSYVESAHEKRTLDWYLANTPLGDEDILRLYIMVGYGASWVNTIGLVDDIALGGIIYYGRIQDAIDAANPSDTIIVHDGTYNENVIVNKPLTIQGAGATPSTVLNASFAGHGFKVTASNVTISGFKIINADNQQPGYAGAYAGVSFESTVGLDNGTVTNNVIEDCNFGVRVSGAGYFWKPFNNFVISYNNMSGITRLGVFGGWQTTNNWIIEHNDIQGGYEQGIELDNGNNNIIRYNKVHNVSLVGIYLVYMMNTQVYGNELWGMTGHLVQYPGQPYYPEAADGIQVLGLDGRNESNIIWNNYCHDNKRSGIHIGRDPGFSASSNYNQVYNNTIERNRLGIMLGPYAISTTVKENTIKDFMKAGIVTRGAKNIFIEGNAISTTLHDEAPNGIDIGIYTGTNGTVKENEISGCSWKDFTGDYETSWSGSGILVIESGDSLEIIGNVVYDCDVGMDIESDSMNITCNEVHNNIYGFVFWNAKPKVNYNNIYSNTQYGVYRTTMGDLTGVLDACYNWWGHETGPYHATSWLYMGEPYGPHFGLGDNVSDYVLYVPWLPVVHDVAVIDVSVSPTTVVAGETVTINVTVKNEGSDYETFTVTVYYDDTPIDSQNVINLFPSRSTTLTFYWNTPLELPRGNYTIKAYATPVVNETDIEDNTLIDGIVEILWHDVAVTDVVADRTWVYQGHTVNINVTVLNEGDFPETVTVTLYYNITANKIIGTQIINLLPGESQTIVFTWDTKGVEYCHNYTLTAVATIIPPDNDPADNTFTDGEVKVRIVGDINGDGKVDMKDIVALILKFGLVKDMPGWDSDCDINNDGKIDMKDVVPTIINYGKTC